MSTTASALATGVRGLVQNFAADVLGLGFGGAAVYGLFTGRMSGAELTASVGLAAFYLGRKSTPTVS